MRRWQIDPVGVDRLLHTAGDEARNLLDSFAPSRLERVDDDLAQTGPVGAHPRAAVQQLLAAQARLLATAAQDASTGIRGVAAAAAGYDHAQTEMADTTHAADAPPLARPGPGRAL